MRLIESNRRILPTSRDASVGSGLSLRLFAGSLGPLVAPVPDGYYTFIDRFLYFINGKTKQASVLCNRPDHPGVATCSQENKAPSLRTKMNKYLADLNT